MLPTPLLVAAKSSELLMNSRRRRYTVSGVISLVDGMLPILDTPTRTYCPSPLRNWEWALTLLDALNFGMVTKLSEGNLPTRVEVYRCEV